MRFEFDSNGYVCCILYGCSTGSCVEYSGLVPSEPEEYTDMDDWADRAQVQAYYLNDQGNLIYDANRAASIPAEDYVETQPYTAEQIKALGILDKVYPVGSIYMSVNDVSPALLFGGTWERIEDRFLLAAGASHDAGEKGGSESHEHIAPIGYEASSKYFGTVNINGNTSDFDAAGGYNTVLRDAGGSTIPDGIVAYYTETVEHLPPYVTVYVWQRVEDANYVSLIDSTGDTVTDANANEVMVVAENATGVAYQSKHTGEEIDAGIDAAYEALEQIQNISLTPGADGKSAYEIALGNGFEGTEEEWLASLKGEKGDTGEVGPQGIQGETGPQGATGADGKYYIPSLSNDGFLTFTSSESDGEEVEQITFATSLKGTAGQPGVDGEDGVSVTHSWNGTVLKLTSASGTTETDLKGEKGEKGDTGANGADGYTPVRGVDYWTDADKEEIVNAVLAAMGHTNEEIAVLGKAILGKMKLGEGG